MLLGLQARRWWASVSPAAAPPATGTTAARSAERAPAKHTADTSVFNLQQFDLIIYIKHVKCRKFYMILDTTIQHIKHVTFVLYVTKFSIP